VAVILVFAAGVAAGAAALDLVAEDGRTALLGEVRSLIDTADGRARTTAGDVLRRALTEYVFKVVGVMALLGLSVIGAPLVLAVVFARGFALGFAAMFLVNGLLLQGVVLAVAALLPQNLLAVPAFVAAGAATLSLSSSATRVLLGRRDINLPQQVVATGLVLAFCCIALVGAAFIEAYVSPVLIHTTARFFVTR